MDILILHGGRLPLVKFFEQFFNAFGLVARSAIDLPSRAKAQKDKVTHYIESARLLLALVTFNEAEPATATSRPNVYVELAEAANKRPADTIVMRELRDGHPVDLGSNLDGRLVIVPFEEQRLHEAIPALVGELRQRGFFDAHSGPAESFEAGSILNRFLDQMDNIWDNEFDVAWEKIYLSSPDHERDFALTLDQFFQNYQSVLSALIRDKMRGAQLEAIADQMLAKSRDLASRAWETVADAKRDFANKKDGRGGEPAQLKSALNELREAKRAMSAQERISHFRKAVTLFDEYLAQDR
ncbi:MAG TPA: hypothetical protein VGR02_14280 [Thermoanaerobaculia bacterium]|nr:hypothetical protein [Thermoanaerobaculia bacterium]